MLSPQFIQCWCWNVKVSIFQSDLKSGIKYKRFQVHFYHWLKQLDSNLYFIKLTPYLLEMIIKEVRLEHFFNSLLKMRRKFGKRTLQTWRIEHIEIGLINFRIFVGSVSFHKWQHKIFATNKSDWNLIFLILFTVQHFQKPITICKTFRHWTISIRIINLKSRDGLDLTFFFYFLHSFLKIFFNAFSFKLLKLHYKFWNESYDQPK